MIATLSIFIIVIIAIIAAAYFSRSPAPAPKPEPEPIVQEVRKEPTGVDMQQNEFMKLGAGSSIEGFDLRN